MRNKGGRGDTWLTAVRGPIAVLHSAVVFHLEWYLDSFFSSRHMDGYRTDGLTLWTSEGVNFGQGSDEAPFAS